MAKPTTRYVCQSCGHQSSGWLGRCPECGAFSTFSEEVVRKATGKSTFKSAGHSPLNGGAAPQPLSAINTSSQPRQPSGIEEFDRVLGGGLVPGSLVLIGGDPGIGKSTLLGEVAAALAKKCGSGLYISGEESVEQVRLRLDRLNITSDTLLLASETDVAQIEHYLRDLKPAFAVIDSIQTTAHPELDSAPGTLTQVRHCATTLQHVAKECGIAIFLVGHVNKEGNLAGPRALEHIVDVVLQLEGDEHGQYRLLRSAKNRFGSVHELGVFEMTEEGMRSVDNPSHLFLSEKRAQASGSVVVATVEGSRPLLVEVQALCTPSYFAAPRRAVSGADFNRVAMILAVLEKRLRQRLGDMDVFVNVVGGMRVTEPALDLGMALAIVSALTDTPLQDKVCVFGEVGLSGEVRQVRHADRRMQEARRLGFTRLIVPPQHAKTSTANSKEVWEANTVQDAVEYLLPLALKTKAAAGKSTFNQSGRKAF